MINDRYVKRGLFGGVEWMRTQSASPRGLIFAPPLIGGHALQQLRFLRPLVRRQMDLFSFSYAGHGGSGGAFCMQASLDNCLAAMDLALEQSHREGLPLFGVASCFGAIPLLHAVDRREEPLAKMVLINALPYLRWKKMAADFYRYWRNCHQWRPNVEGLKAALRNYRDELLPNVTHSHQAFGILSRRRIKWLRMIGDLFSLQRYDSRPLRSTLVFCVYGQNDRLLHQIGFSDWQDYEAHIENICPRSRFRRFDSDHFFTGVKIRQQLISAVEQFFLMDSKACNFVY